MYIFGGYVAGSKSNDLWKFDLKTNQWTCLDEGEIEDEFAIKKTTSK